MSRDPRTTPLALALTLAGGLSLSACGTGADADPAQVVSEARGSGQAGSGTVSARLGGRAGILAFLHTFAVPALLADPEIVPFFGNLTETPDDIEQCLANLLDHDLGGDSPKNGAVLASGHVCRSSMSEIHRGLAIPDRIVTKFITIAGGEALAAGVAPADVEELGKALERYRGGVREK